MKINPLIQILPILVLMSVSGGCQKDVDLVEDSAANLKYYYKTGTETIREACSLQNGGMAYTGSSLGQAYVFVIDSDGKEIWEFSEDADQRSTFTDIIELTDGGLLVCGFSNASEFGVSGSDLGSTVYRFDAGGQLLWKREKRRANSSRHCASGGPRRLQPAL